ncbi:enoyl-CoA hydratase/isomerase family protein [Amycolatopsis albispora]|uniref:enoyl-CoA hydratase/isomerase family protein n=1 Tax=Amycolatopsis albispora TaxID=1804986 RepID=UPI003AAD07F1
MARAPADARAIGVSALERDVALDADAQWNRAVARAAEDGQVGVIVLTGAGERAFSAGGDVATESARTISAAAGADAFDERCERLYQALRDCLKPVIARVDGYAIRADTTWRTCATSRSPRTGQCSGRTGRAWPARPRDGSSATSGPSSA